MHEVSVHREKGDLFGISPLSFLFKNRYMLLLYRLSTLFLLLYAIIYGFINPTEENIFTRAVFWSIFWPFFMVITLPTLGNVFCMVCPHGFLGKHITKVGLKLRAPRWLKNPYIGLLVFNILAYWFVLYTFPGALRTPLATASFFLFFTLLSLLFFFLFRGMAYCKYVCPIGSVNTAFSRTSFTWLSTYGDICKDCKKPACALNCPYELNPSKFEERNSMTNCTLCMECARSCDAVKFEFRPWGTSLLKPIKNPKFWEVWVYILMVAVITFTMRLHHGLSRSAVGEYMPWVVIGKYLKESLNLPVWIDPSGLLALLTSLSFVLLITYISFWLVSSLTGRSFSEVFLTLGYAFAPLMIVGGLSHVLEFFFIEYYHNTVNGFSQAFGLELHVSPLAKRGEIWLKTFQIFPLIAGLWSLYILWRRAGFIASGRRTLVFLIASLLPISYIILWSVSNVLSLFFGMHRH